MTQEKGRTPEYLGYNWNISSTGGQVINNFFNGLGNGKTIREAYIDANINYNYAGYDGPYLAIFNEKNVNDTAKQIGRDSSMHSVKVYWGDVDFLILQDKKEMKAYDPRRSSSTADEDRKLPKLPDNLIKAKVDTLLGSKKEPTKDHVSPLSFSKELKRPLPYNLQNFTTKEIIGVAKSIFKNTTGLGMPAQAECSSMMTMNQANGNIATKKLAKKQVSAALIRFRHYLNGAPLESDFISMRLGRAGNISIHSTWHVVQDVQEIPQRTCTSARGAVANALEDREDLSENAIQFCRLVYVIGSKDSIMPKWKIIFKTGEVMLLPVCKEDVQR